MSNSFRSCDFEATALAAASKALKERGSVAGVGAGGGLYEIGGRLQRTPALTPLEKYLIASHQFQSGFSVQG